MILLVSGISEINGAGGAVDMCGTRGDDMGGDSEDDGDVGRGTGGVEVDVGGDVWGGG